MRSLLLCAVALAACGGGGVREAPSVRDSAGIRIVENVGTGDQAEHFAETPRLVLGDDETRPETVFYRVAGAVRLADGRIVVADGSSGELRFFAHDGTHLGTVGGLGGGPAEFGELSSLMRIPGDTLLALDRGRQRIAMFTDSGEFARGLSYRGLAFGPGAFLAGRLDDGSLVLVDPGALAKMSIPTGLSPGQVRDTALVVRLVPDGSDADTVAMVLGAMWSVERVEELGSIPFPVPMPYSPAPLVYAHGNRIVLGDGDGYELRVLDATTGRIQRILRTRHAPVAVRDADIETFMQRYRDQVGDDLNPAAAITIRLLESAPVHEHMPAFGGFPAPTLIDTAGWLWVPSYMPQLTAFGDTPDNARVSYWDVFDAAGEWQGRVVSPPDFRLTDFRVFGVGVQMVDGVERVVVLESGMGMKTEG